MCVETGIACCPGQVLVVFIRNMLIRFRIAKFFRQTKVNDKHNTTLLAQPHQEIIWFDISMYEVFAMNIFYLRNLENDCIQVNRNGFD